MRERLGRAQQIVLLTSDVACVSDTGHLPSFIDFEDGTTAAQQVPRIVEFHFYVVVQIEVAVVADGNEKPDTGPCVFLSKNGLQRGQALFAAFLVEPFHVVLLYEARVGEHDAAQVLGGRGAYHLPTEAQLVEIGDEAAVVDVGVSEDDVVDFFGVDHDVAVGGIGFEALALEHATIQEDFLSVVGGDEVLAARHFLGCTDEFDFHRLKFAPKI